MKSSQPVCGTGSPVCAAKAIGTPQAKARPSTNCGAAIQRFMKG